MRWTNSRRAVPLPPPYLPAFWAAIFCWLLPRPHPGRPFFVEEATFSVEEGRLMARSCFRTCTQHTMSSRRQTVQPLSLPAMLPRCKPAVCAVSKGLNNQGRTYQRGHRTNSAGWHCMVPERQRDRAKGTQQPEHKAQPPGAGLHLARSQQPTTSMPTAMRGQSRIAAIAPETYHAAALRVICCSQPSHHRSWQGRLRACTACHQAGTRSATSSSGSAVTHTLSTSACKVMA